MKRTNEKKLRKELEGLKKESLIEIIVRHNKESERFTEVVEKHVERFIDSQF